MTGTLRPRGGPMNSRPAVGTPRKVLTSHPSRLARACRARVRCDRRAPVPKVDVTMGMYRGARAC